MAWKKRNMILYLVFALIFHIFSFLGIFDVYFRSPIVQNVEPVESDLEPLAKRVVLFLSDSLRADMAFSNFRYPDGTFKPLTPFLHSKVTAKGSFGVSHAKMPTETGFGHMSILSGFYGDLSSIGKGFFSPKIPFDSIILQSKYFFATALNGFESHFAPHGKFPSSVYFVEYGSENVIAHPGLTDQWVVDEVTKLFQSAESDPMLRKKLHSNGIGFYFYFGGMDKCGHSRKPMSKM